MGKENILTVRILVVHDENLSVSEYEEWDSQFNVLDCEFSDFIPNASLKPEFVEFIAQKHGVTPTDFDAIQSIA